MGLPDPIPDELTVKQVADRWRVKYQNPADENYVLACYGSLQFCNADFTSMRLVNYSRDEIIAQVKKECPFMEYHDFVRDLPQYEKTMLRVRKNDLLSFEAGAGDKQPESAPAAQANKLRTNTLDPAIDKAIQQAGCVKLASVYLKLKEMALSGESPFTGKIEGDKLCYTDDNDKIQYFSKNALGKRLKRR